MVIAALVCIFDDLVAVLTRVGVDVELDFALASSSSNLGAGSM